VLFESAARLLGELGIEISHQEFVDIFAGHGLLAGDGSRVV
jgi:trimethylamine:corrinoid methyltransferase-like protein